MKNSLRNTLSMAVVGLVLGVTMWWNMDVEVSMHGAEQPGIQSPVEGKSSSQSSIQDNTDIEYYGSPQYGNEDYPLPPGFDPDDVAVAWAKVDLASLEREMPGNLYWLLSAPTEDQNVLDERQRIKEYWTDQYNRINANLASEEEIYAYFEHRTKVASDNVAFATALLNRYGAVMPERGRHLQTFARNLNLVQLQELPKKLQNALESRDAFLQRRNEWLADKQAYEAKLAQEREAALRNMGKI